CDGLDNDCNGSIDDGVSCDPDNDGDGYPQSVDCDDYNSSINPGATEECNEIDDNCNGEIDEGVTVYAYYTDYDGDYFGPDDGLFYSCYIINDLTTVGGDCDDYNYSVNPSVAEVCYNGIDDNCDGSIDEYCDPDNDGDGYPQSMDCDDNNFEINPGAYDDVCNGIDRNCDGMVDLAPHILLYADADADGYGNDYDYNYFSVCALPTGYVEYGGDCDDDNSSVYPGAEEVCNGIDDNCDGTIDDNCRLIGQQQCISIFPNPASHQFTINAAVTGTLQGQAYIYIYNALGEEILVVQTEIQNGKIQKTILFDEGNASGIYLVKITAGGAAELHTQLVLE
ncbi:MAG: MopE-related protein, partial [Chitinophagales bacterium]